MVSLGSFLPTASPNPWLHPNPALTNCKREQQIPGLQFLGLQFSCPALRFSCLPRGQGICEIKPPAAKGGKAMETRLGMLWDTVYHNPNTIQRHGGGRKPEEIRNKSCCFPSKLWGQEQTQTQTQVSGNMQGPTLRDYHAPGEGNSGWEL